MSPLKTKFKIVWILIGAMIASACRAPISTGVPPTAPAPTALPQTAVSLAKCSVDVHQHLNAFAMQQGKLKIDWDAAAKMAITLMDEVGIQKILIMPPPLTADHQSKYDYTELAAITKSYPDRFAFVAGGGTLNPILNQAVASGSVSASMKSEFETKAKEIVRAGAAAFGEIASLHFSFSDTHPFIYAPPDHTLFLSLADIAAQENMPIDLHIEIVAQKISLPKPLKSPPNPATLEPNLQAFERLLSHNPKARIVWAHVGWDNTGQMTTSLLRQLLEKHPNLYMSIKITEPTSAEAQVEANRPIDSKGKIRSDWLKLISDYPDRFLIGADEFFSQPNTPRTGPPSTKMTWSIVNQLPPDVARKVACENVTKIYRMGK
jgi:predicted TIM-barrel fold metal-dependent hydrolase